MSLEQISDLRDVVVSVVEDYGFLRVKHIEEAKMPNNFIVNILYSEEKPICIYPVTKKVNLAHELLSLYGTHWRYRAGAADILKLDIEMGDLNNVLESIETKEKPDWNFPSYQFTQRMVENNGLWIPKGDAAVDFIDYVVRSRYEFDKRVYRELKEEAKSERVSRTIRP